MRRVFKLFDRRFTAVIFGCSLVAFLGALHPTVLASVVDAISLMVISLAGANAAQKAATAFAIHRHPQPKKETTNENG